MKKIFTIICVFGFIFLGILYFEKFLKNYENNFQNPEKNLVKIIAKNQNNEKISEWTGWKIYDQMVITALHNVENEQYLYTINNEIYTIFEKNTENDWAILKSQENWENILEKNENFENIFNEGKMGQKVWTYVWREDGIKVLTGEIVAQDMMVFGLENAGAVKKIFIKNLTDLAVQEGDSGSPVFIEGGKMVDVIHIAK